jgi:hypothetical protein
VIAPRRTRWRVVNEPLAPAAAGRTGHGADGLRTTKPT